MNTTARPVVYLGFNDPRKHCRGTEKVIRLQAQAAAGRTYYLFRGTRTDCFRWGTIVAVSLPWNYLAAFQALRQLLARITRRHGAPIIHAHNYLLAALVMRGTLVFTVHDALKYLKRSSGARLLRLYGLIEWWIYLRSQRIHAVSQYAWKQAVGTKRFATKMTVIHNSVSDHPALSVAAGEVVRCAVPYLLVVRSIEERANLSLILDLARTLRDRHSDLSVVVVGKGPLERYFRRQVEEAGLINVRFVGYVTDAALDGLYRHTRCVIMPALYGEGFGLPLIEAYSRGVPAIASHVCAVPEVIYRHDWMFENTVESLLKALEAAQDANPRALRAFFEERFGRETVLAAYRCLYGGL